MHALRRAREKALEDLGLKAEVDLESGTATVEGEASDEKVIAAVEATGYKATK